AGPDAFDTGARHVQWLSPLPPRSPARAEADLRESRGPGGNTGPRLRPRFQRDRGPLRILPAPQRTLAHQADTLRLRHLPFIAQALEGAKFPRVLRLR